MDEDLTSSIISSSSLKQQKPHTFTLQQQVIVLIVGMLTWVAWPYVFDIPQGVQTQLQHPPYILTISQFNTLYVICSLPNSVLSLVSGWMTLKIGITKSIMLYSFILLIGQVLLTISVSLTFNGWYGLFIFGRFLVGFSGYALTGANLSVLPMYTNPKLVSLFVGLGCMIPWVFESFTDLLTPIIYQKTQNIAAPFFFGCGFAVLSVISALCLYIYTGILDKRRPKSELGQAPITKIKQIKKLGKVMVVIFVTLLFAVSVQGSIIVNANDMLHERVGFTNPQAGTIAMMTLLINGPCTPLWAFAREKSSKKRIFFLFIGLVLFIDTLVLYLLPQQVNPLSFFMAYLGFILLGVWDSGAVTMIVGSIPAVLDQNVLPLGFSLYTSSLALGLGLAPLVTAAIIQASPNLKQGYKNTYYFYFVCVIFALIGLCYLWLSKNPQAQKMQPKVKDETLYNKITKLNKVPDSSIRQ